MRQCIGNGKQIAQHRYPGTPGLFLIKLAIPQRHEETGVPAHGVLGIARAILKIPLLEHQPQQKLLVGDLHCIFLPPGSIRLLQAGIKSRLTFQNTLSLPVHLIPADGISLFTVGMAAVHTHSAIVPGRKSFIFQEHFRNRTVIALRHDRFYPRYAAALFFIFFFLLGCQLFLVFLIQAIELPIPPMIAHVDQAGCQLYRGKPLCQPFHPQGQQIDPAILKKGLYLPGFQQAHSLQVKFQHRFALAAAAQHPPGPPEGPALLVCVVLFPCVFGGIEDSHAKVFDAGRFLIPDHRPSHRLDPNIQPQYIPQGAHSPFSFPVDSKIFSSYNKDRLRFLMCQFINIHQNKHILVAVSVYQYPSEVLR